MAFLPGLLSTAVSSGVLPKLIETGAGLLTNLLGGLGQDRSAPPAPVAHVAPMSDIVSKLSRAMEYPSDITTPATTPAGRIVMPDRMGASNYRTVVVPSPFRPRKTAGPRAIPYGEGPEEHDVDPYDDFRVVSFNRRKRRGHLSAPRPRDALTRTEKKVLKKMKKLPPPSRYKRYF